MVKTMVLCLKKYIRRMAITLVQMKARKKKYTLLIVCGLFFMRGHLLFEIEPNF